MPLAYLLDLLTGQFALVITPGTSHNPITPSIVGANAALTLLGP
jgi:hypothetical protein